MYDSFERLDGQLQALRDRLPDGAAGLLGDFCANMGNFRFEIKELLARMDAEPYEDCLDAVEKQELRRLHTKLHKPVAFEPTSDPELHNTVAAVRKTGFYWRGRLLRAEEVALYRHVPRGAAKDTDHGGANG